ncbi:MAG TPA: SpoIID/LytB domain-containing protein [Paludibacteraceae bacterium]|nr:SpoIID/LytB domain-containing protein [Paludibacteraceae bacterium]
MITKEPIIQVGILSSSRIEFILNGAFMTSDGKKVSGKQQVGWKNGMILFDGKTSEELSFQPLDESSTFDLLDVVIGIHFHWERKENQRFKGNLKIIVEHEQLTAINEIKAEDYLVSVISSEMSATSSIELLKAHAVVSRSWLFYPLQKEKKNFSGRNSVEENSENRHIKWYERGEHEHFDVCADDHCQRYQGITRATSDAVLLAVEATRGEVLRFGQHICDARFSKCCGGVTETFDNCWAPEEHPYLESIVDNDLPPQGFHLDLSVEANAREWILSSPSAFCNTNDKNVLSQVLNNYDQETMDFYRWKVVYSQKEIAEILCRRSGYDFGEILDLIPLKRGKSGRIVELKIVGTKRTLIVGKELEIRKWLSNTHLYSSAFVVEKEDDRNQVPGKFVLTGAGWGHGVGLCQIGAAVMGEKGYSYDRILLHYFRGAELKRIYE